MSGNHSVFLLLGGNLGHVEQAFERVEFLTHKKVGKIVSKSSIYGSKSWGFATDNDFLNRVIQVISPLAPEELLTCILQMEKDLGRNRNQVDGGYASRTIDIDILFFDDRVCDTNSLTIPHPKLHERKFTLEPLNEIAPQYIHPVLKKTVADLLRDCKDAVPVWKK